MTGVADGGTGREPRRQSVRRGAMTGRATERAMDRRRGSGVRRRRQWPRTSAGEGDRRSDGGSVRGRGATVEVADLGASDGGEITGGRASSREWKWNAPNVHAFRLGADRERDDGAAREKGCPIEDRTPFANERMRASACGRVTPPPTWRPSGAGRRRNGSCSRPSPPRPDAPRRGRRRHRPPRRG